MVRLIDADALYKRMVNTPIKAVKGVDYDQEWFTRIADTANCFVDMVASAPIIDAVPVVRGKWTLWGRRGIYGVMYECSSCHAKYDGITRFCPNCGADMRGEHDGD